MDFESPDVEKEFPGLYASETAKKSQSRDSDYSDEEKVSRKDLLIGKRRERKESKKDKGYIAFEGESSEDDMDETKSPEKNKKSKSTFKFSVKDKKEKPGRLKEKEAKEKKEKEEEKEKENKKDKSKDQKKKKKERNLLKIKDKKKKCPGEEVSEKPVFGVPLHEAVEGNRSRDGIELPVVVRECIDYIEEHGLHCEGIYRISGVKSKVRNLKAQYNKGEKVYLYEHEPHIVASLLKQFLRDLPAPILTTELSTKFEEASSIKNEQKRVEMLSKLIESLPNCNRLLVSWIFVHMLHVIQLEKKNKMNLQNVSIVLSPSMQISHRVLQALFSHSDVLFKGVEIKKYVPPIEPDSTRLSLELPDSPAAIEEELSNQENLLNVIHAELNAGLQDKQKEEQLWEIQRIVTQLKRKLRFLKQVQDASKLECGENATKTEPKTCVDDFHVDTTLQKPMDAVLPEAEGISQLSNALSENVKPSKTPTVAEVSSSISNESVPLANKENIAIESSDDPVKHSEILENVDSIPVKSVASEDITHSISVKSVASEDITHSIPVKSVADEDITHSIPVKSIGDDDVARKSEISLRNSDVSVGDDAMLVPKDAELTLVEEICIPNHEGQPSICGEATVSSNMLEVISSKDNFVPENASSHHCRPSQLDLRTEPPVSIDELMEPSTEILDETNTMSNKVVRKLSEEKALDTNQIFVADKGDAVASASPDSEQMITEDEEFSSLLREEQLLILRQEELVMLGDELRRKITSERQEVERLKSEIKEYQQLYKYKQYSFDSTENSSSESDSSDSDEEDNTIILEDLIKENLVLEQKNKDLIQHIQQERESRMDIKVRMKMLQQEVKPTRA